MPFMIGRSPIRRTLNYLEAGKIILRETVKIFTVHYTYTAENHKGIRDFVFWHLDQIQYKNPAVQCLTFKDLMPSPFIRIFFENAEDIIINVNCREKNDILNHLINFTAVCKSHLSEKFEILLKEILISACSVAFYENFPVLLSANDIIQEIKYNFSVFGLSAKFFINKKGVEIRDEILLSKSQESMKDNDSLFGYGCNKHCICEIMGQVPCPRIVNLPNIWRKSRKYNTKKFNVPYYYTERGLDETEEE